MRGHSRGIHPTETNVNMPESRRDAGELACAPIGLGILRCLFRGFRCSPPPAIRLHPFGVNLNTAHLSTLMQYSILFRVDKFGCFCLIGYLPTFRLTPRGLRRPRLETTRSSNISSSTALCRAFLSRGGKSRKLGQFAANNAHGMHIR